MSINDKAREAQLAYRDYMDYDGNDKIYTEDLRWRFIDLALAVLEDITGESYEEED